MRMGDDVMKWLLRFFAVLTVSIVLVVFAFAVHYTYVQLFAGGNPVVALSEPASARSTGALSLRDAESAIVSAAGDVMPAVVSVQTKQTIPGWRHPFADDPLFRRFFGEGLFPQQAPRDLQGLGSGVIVDSSGLVITNNHVIDGATEIEVKTDDGKEYPAKVLGTDARLDIAVLKIEREGPFPSARLGNSDDLRVGMFVLAIGTPFNPQLSQTVTMGIVSALSRSGLGIEQVEDFIQTDAAINKGNSGGPLVNLDGEVVGINVAIVTGGSSGSAGVGFAIPINSARHSFESILQNGKVIRGYLGVSIQNIDDELRQSLGLSSTKGALVTEVMEASPAAKAGIRRGDVVLKWRGREIRTASSLTDVVSRTQVGESVECEIFRDGKTQTVRVVVDERPADIDSRGSASAPASDGVFEKLGVTVKYVEGADAKQYGLPTMGCVMVVKVDEGSPAAEKGIEAGTGILEVDARAIESVSDLEAALSEAGRHRLLVRYRGSNRYITVNLE
jgi:serine protease Do